MLGLKLIHVGHCWVYHPGTRSSGKNVLGDRVPIDITGLIIGLRPANERWCYFVTTSLIGWAQA